MTSLRYCRIAPGRQTAVPRVVPRLGTSWPARDMAAESLEQFVEDDIENIVQLFNVFNKGTHGAAGTFDLPQLGAVRKRVENGIMFLTEIIGNA